MKPDRYDMMTEDELREEIRAIAEARRVVKDDNQIAAKAASEIGNTEAAAHASEEQFGLCLSHRAAYRLAKPDKCPICRLLDESEEHYKHGYQQGVRDASGLDFEAWDGSGDPPLKPAQASEK